MKKMSNGMQNLKLTKVSNGMRNPKPNDIKVLSKFFQLFLENSLCNREMNTSFKRKSRMVVARSLPILNYGSYDEFKIVPILLQ